MRFEKARLWLVRKLMGWAVELHHPFFIRLASISVIHAVMRERMQHLKPEELAEEMNEWTIMVGRIQHEDDEEITEVIPGPPPTMH